MTSKMMSVALTLKKEKKPTLAATEASTITTPAMPKQNFMSIMIDSKVAKRRAKKPRPLMPPPPLLYASKTRKRPRVSVM